MPAPALPVFRYHPDPLRTGSVVASDSECVRCGEARGYVYALAPIAEEDIEPETLCPWCIEDGSAAREYEATFVDGDDVVDLIPEEAFALLVERTPGYSAWQSEEWRVCCGDAAAFLGPFGRAEMEDAASESGLHPEDGLLEYIANDLDFGDDRAPDVVASLDRDKGPTAYLFQCLHCRTHLFHVDFP